MNKPRKSQVEPAQTFVLDPFPELRTMPSGWDLSALLPDAGDLAEADLKDSSSQ